MCGNFTDSMKEENNQNLSQFTFGGLHCDFGIQLIFILFTTKRKLDNITLSCAS